MPNTLIRSARLHSTHAGSDKVYNVYLAELPDAKGYIVNFENGRRGSTLTPGTKTASPVTLEKATAIFEKLVKEKVNGSSHYKPIDGGDTASAQLSEVGARQEAGYAPMLPRLAGYEVKNIAHRLTDDGWGAQQKFDGERVMVLSDKGAISGIQKTGYVRALPSHIEEAMSRYVRTTLIDGELVGDDYYVFDALLVDGRDLRYEPYEERYRRAKELVSAIGHDNIHIVATAFDTKTKNALLARVQARGAEGMVFKRLDATYDEGESEAVEKFKPYAGSSVIVHAHKPDKRSVVTAAYKEGVYTVLGAVTISPSKPIPPVGSVIECNYLYAHEGTFALFQPEFDKVRADQLPEACQVEKFKMKPPNEALDFTETGEDEYAMPSPA